MRTWRLIKQGPPLLDRTMQKFKQYNGIVDENDLEYVRKRYGTPILGIPAPLKGRKINPHVSRFLLNDRRSVVDIFHIKPVYYLSISGEWRPLSEITSYFGNKNGMILKGNYLEKMSWPYLTWYIKRQEILKGRGVRTEWTSMPILLNTTTTVFPDPSPESTSVDGHCRVESAVFLTARNAASSDSAQDADATGRGAEVGVFTGVYDIRRAFFLFDTSAIPDTDTISSATMSIKCNGVNDQNLTQSYITVISTAPASNIAITTADFDQVRDSGGNIGISVTETMEKESADIDLSGATSAAYNDFILNATGISRIDSAGISKFGLAIGWDIEEVTYGGGANTQDSFDDINYAETADTTTDPKLAVVHAAAAVAGMNLLNLLGVT